MRNWPKDPWFIQGNLGGKMIVTDPLLQLELRHQAHSSQLTVKLLIVLAKKTTNPSTINFAQDIKILRQWTIMSTNPINSTLITFSNNNPIMFNKNQINLKTFTTVNTNKKLLFSIIIYFYFPQSSNHLKG